LTQTAPAGVPLKEEKKADPAPVSHAASVGGGGGAKAGDWHSLNPKNLHFAYDIVRSKPPPDGVDGKNLEAFLADADFKEWMKMSRDAFYKLPAWQQLRCKKAAGMF